MNSKLKKMNLKLEKPPELEYRIFGCDCNDMSHLFRFSKFTDMEQIYVSIVLNHYLSFWERVRLAYRYIFKFDTKAVAFYDEVVLSKKDIKVAIDFLKKKSRKKT